MPQRDEFRVGCPGHGQLAVSRVILNVLGALLLTGAGLAAVILLRPKPLPSVNLHSAASRTAQIAAGQLPELKAGSWQGIKPSYIGLSGDGGDVITGIKWSAWNATEAVGTGSRTLQSCIPDCATGKDTVVPETLVLSEPQDGFFTVIVARFAGQVAEYTSGGPELWPLDAGTGSA